MELIQLDKDQFHLLNQSVIKIDRYQFLKGAIPPEHVLRRSIINNENGVCSLWSFPYFINENGQIMGSCGFKREPSKGCIEIGYNVAPEAQGKGVASLAVKLLCEKAFQSSEVATVQALISSKNKASLNVVRKNGFSYICEVV